MLTIRLSRTGKRKQPYYRIVVQEVLGNLNPRGERKDTVVNAERALYWIGKGAMPSTTVRNLFVDLGLVKGEKTRNITISGKRAKKLEAAKAKEVAA